LEAQDYQPYKKPDSLESPVLLGKQADTVSLDEVQKAVDRLTADGKRVTLRSVHAEVGRGSRSTIHKHVSVLRARYSSSEAVEISGVSPQVARVWATELQREVAERTARALVDLEDARAALDLLVEENDSLRAENVEAARLLSSARDAHAEQSGMVVALKSQLESTERQLREERAQGERLHLDIASYRERLAVSEARCTRVDSELAEEKSLAASLQKELLSAKEILEESRRECITLRTKLDGVSTTEDAMKQLAQRKRALQAELGDARSQIAAHVAERTGLLQRLEDYKQSKSQTDSLLQELVGKLLHSSGEQDGTR
jgi:chromosome segregation ATPase